MSWPLSVNEMGRTRVQMTPDGAAASCQQPVAGKIDGWSVVVNYAVIQVSQLGEMI